jgi:hypothetical protein
MRPTPEVLLEAVRTKIIERFQPRTLCVGALTITEDADVPQDGPLMYGLDQRRSVDPESPFRAEFRPYRDSFRVPR